MMRISGISTTTVLEDRRVSHWGWQRGIRGLRVL